ncbi:hypothetical protein [Rickettsia tamurae]|uniref:hypothetical protein n=1 Tax=Rickettsia tamurae TaxID=334545 RepID=UPI001BFE91F8|nr:hypothetical protein [Rickettsia tamurae]
MLLREPVKPTVSPRGLTMGSIKTIKNTNNFSIFNWIPRSSRGMDTEKTDPCNNALREAKRQSRQTS